MSTHPSPALAQAEGWEVSTSPFGHGEWLMATIPDGGLAVVPPAVPAGPDEQPERRGHWRVVTWTGDLNELELEPLPLDLGAVVEHVDGVHREWVAAVGDRQLRHLELLARPNVGPDHEQRARAAAVRRDALLAELEQAFPERSWRENPGRLPRVPRDVPELLRRIDGPGRSRADTVWDVLEGGLECVFYTAVWCYRRLPVAGRAVSRQARRVRHSEPRTPTPPASGATASRQETGQFPAFLH